MFSALAHAVYLERKNKLFFLSNRIKHSDEKSGDWYFAREMPNKLIENTYRPTNCYRKYELLVPFVVEFQMKPFEYSTVSRTTLTVYRHRFVSTLTLNRIFTDFECLLRIYLFIAMKCGEKSRNVLEPNSMIGISLKDTDSQAQPANSRHRSASIYCVTCFCCCLLLFELESIGNWKILCVSLRL